jgi:hypothetical protein
MRGPEGSVGKFAGLKVRRLEGWDPPPLKAWQAEARRVPERELLGDTPHFLERVWKGLIGKEL